MIKKIYTIDKVLFKLFQKFPGLDGVQGFKLAHMRGYPWCSAMSFPLLGQT